MTDHNDVFALVRLGHLVVPSRGVLVERAARREPLSDDESWSSLVSYVVESLTREAASSVRDVI